MYQTLANNFPLLAGSQPTPDAIAPGPNTTPNCKDPSSFSQTAAPVRTTKLAWVWETKTVTIEMNLILKERLQELTYLLHFPSDFHPQRLVGLRVSTTKRTFFHLTTFSVFVSFTRWLYPIDSCNIKPSLCLSREKVYQSKNHFSNH